MESAPLHNFCSPVCVFFSQRAFLSDCKIKKEREKKTRHLFPGSVLQWWVACHSFLANWVDGFRLSLWVPGIVFWALRKGWASFAFRCVEYFSNVCTFSCLPLINAKAVRQWLWIVWRSRGTQISTPETFSWSFIYLEQKSSLISNQSYCLFKHTLRRWEPSLRKPVKAIPSTLRLLLILPLHRNCVMLRVIVWFQSCGKNTQELIRRII